jgi:hypothetical protein
MSTSLSTVAAGAGTSSSGAGTSANGAGTSSTGASGGYVSIYKCGETKTQRTLFWSLDFDGNLVHLRVFITLCVFIGRWGGR